jgi:hypothetical protein
MSEEIEIPITADLNSLIGILKRMRVARDRTDLTLEKQYSEYMSLMIVANKIWIHIVNNGDPEASEELNQKIFEEQRKAKLRREQGE